MMTNIIYGGMIWLGMVWYGMVWYDMVWYGMVQCKTVNKNTAENGTDIQEIGRIVCFSSQNWYLVDVPSKLLERQQQRHSICS